MKVKPEGSSPDESKMTRSRERNKRRALRQIFIQPHHIKPLLWRHLLLIKLIRRHTQRLITPIPIPLRRNRMSPRQPRRHTRLPHPTPTPAPAQGSGQDIGIEAFLHDTIHIQRPRRVPAHQTQTSTQTLPFKQRPEILFGAQDHLIERSQDIRHVMFRIGMSSS